jgi:hypothetical protein
VSHVPPSRDTASTPVTVPDTPANAFTPGPWFSDVTDEVCAMLSGGAVVSVALVNPMAELTPAAQAANARLIAAAPDLVEALEALTSALDQLYGDNPILCDCVDNSGRPYTSAWLAAQMESVAKHHEAARAALTKARSPS